MEASNSQVKILGGYVDKVFTIVPNDTVATAKQTRAIFVGVDGDLKVDLAGVGTGITFKNLVGGQFYPICATKVYAAGTTATYLLGVY